MNMQDHPLVGIRAKIERADENIRNLKSEINALINGDTYTLVSKVNDDATRRSIRLVGPEPPLRFAVLAGEIVHQLRSSLDHLVWALVINNKNIPTKQTQYPICDTLEDFESPPKCRYIKGISDSAKTIIQSRQPYRTSADINRNFLYILRELNNSDKHRLLVFFVTSIDRLHLADVAARSEMSEPDKVNVINYYPAQRIYRPTENGTEIFRVGFDKPEPDLRTLGKPTLNVSFGDFGAMTEQPIIHVISQVRDKVGGLIDSFESEFS